MMKDGVVIVNTARGAVMDEEALVQALKSGKVASVGLDVFEDEPNVHPGLVADERVMLVPHMGTFTYEVSEQITRETVGAGLIGAIDAVEDGVLGYRECAHGGGEGSAEEYCPGTGRY
jgi:phosphoglycerate dehydrogenase-like enzyme